jgi:hypothetical protein
MKLKHVLNEGPISYRGAGGERYAAWEEPNDEPEPGYHEDTVVMPFATADSTEIKVKVRYNVSGRVGEQLDLDDVELLAVVLPSGKEVDPETASNILGKDQLDPSDPQTQEALAEWLCDYLKDEEGWDVSMGHNLRQHHKVNQAAPAKARAPAAAAPAPQAEPTAA